MDTFERLVEERIQEAAERGDLADLPGMGRPLPAEPDTALVPPELRMAYRILKNAGYLPEELQRRREIHDLTELLSATQEDSERREIEARLRLLLDRLGAARGGSLLTQEHYYRRLLDRLDQTRRRR